MTWLSSTAKSFQMASLRQVIAHAVSVTVVSLAQQPLTMLSSRICPPTALPSSLIELVQSSCLTSRKQTNISPKISRNSTLKTCSTLLTMHPRKITTTWGPGSRTFQIHSLLALMACKRVTSSYPSLAVGPAVNSPEVDASFQMSRVWFKVLQIRAPGQAQRHRTWMG